MSRLDAGLLADVRGRLADQEVDDDAVGAALAASGRVLGSAALRDLTRAARAELAGAGPLQPLLELPGATDVVVNGPHDVWLDRGRGLERADLDLGTPGAVRALAVRLAALAGQRLDDAAPVCDGRLPDGTRLHAVVEPVVPAGAAISLRVLRQSGLGVTALAAGGSLAPGWEALLRGLVAGRANVLISGGTGTGKTTLLAALLGLVPVDERIVTVEEARELAPAHPHVVPLVTRRANVEGAGAVGLTELVRAALRMRPDRIVVGECRGAEVREVLLALNTGHDGGFATLHANAVEHVPARLEALAALAGMSRDAVAAQAVAAVDVVLHVRRKPGRRFVEAVGVVARDAGGFAVREVARWDGSAAETTVVDPRAWDALQARWCA
ncbi:type II secretion system protein E [Xylanimonas cellulosilytica DSM 15894]|uniref:Type II secretion system protein E n=1 Tax=Xylanimonas cellulosilytica (strain DSM 15894 / JCM 12276 / CECT 5975 / KCTC 9989 / LMG 20990 / NBRC 107835 / XIL07) TaxID=446471 RepID=D1BV92_XYLCX|nr:TadA family conjugal transfer-associated ATPase [Xylanimonas cellulosilytica]ACZ29363.1 type II secretion system protein E [Xylanimonas cellulosilytica DSM 15894]